MNLSFMGASLFRMVAYSTIIAILVSCGLAPEKQSSVNLTSSAMDRRIMGQLLKIEKQFQHYFSVNGKFPLTKNIRSTLPVDPWGKRYQIQLLRNMTGLKIYSLGADRKRGGKFGNKDLHIYIIPIDKYYFASLVFAIAENMGKTVAITAHANKAGNKLIQQKKSWLSSDRFNFENAIFKTATYQNLIILYHKNENINQLLKLAQKNNRLVYNVYTNGKKTKKRMVVVGHFPSILFLKVVKMYCQEKYRILFNKSDEFIIHAPNWWQESLCYYFPVILAINNIKLHLNQGKIFGQHVKN